MSDSQTTQPSAASETGVRGWLKRNKIFFETLATPTLAGAAIVISLVQLNESQQQNQIIELQAKIAEAHELPVFEFKPTASGQLTIENVGGPAAEFRANPSYRLSVSATTAASPLWTTITILVNDYYPTKQQYTLDAKGTLATIDAPNAKSVRDAMSDLQAHPKPFDKIIWTDATDVDVDYLDILGDRQIDYFQVTNTEGGIKTTEFNSLAKSAGFTPDYEYVVTTSQLTSQNVLQWLQKPNINGQSGASKQ